MKIKVMCQGISHGMESGHLVSSSIKNQP